MIAVLASGVLVAQAGKSRSAPKPREMKVACAGDNGVLRYVSRASRCRKSERVVTLDRQNPIDACVKLHGTLNGVRGSLSQLRGAGSVRRLPAGTTRLSPPANCPAEVQPNETGILLPGPKKTWFCARNSDGRLRWVSRRSKCSRSRERGIWVPQGSPRAPDPGTPQAQGNKSPKTGDDSVTTDKDAPIAIAVLANDSDDDGDPLSIESVDTNGTKGTVVTNPNGTISYDPAGQFTNLKPGQVDTDRFKYKAQDNRGGHSGTTHVDITIKGKNLAPTAVNDSGSTDEETVDNLAVLGNDTDPEGDALSLGPIDDTGTAGDPSAGAGNTIDYDPDNQFEDLGVGETRQDTFKYRANDGTSNSNLATVTMTVSGVNDAPTVDTTNSALAYAEGDGPVAVDNGLAVDDVDGDQLTGATVTLSPSPAEDTLAFVPQLGITGSYNSGTGVLTLTGSASAADYQTVLRSVVYNNNSDNPSTALRTTSFKVTDQHGADSNTDTRDINVSRVNDAPLLSNGGNLSYTEGDPATVISSTLTVADIDDTNLESGKVELTLGHESADDLSWTDNNGGDGITLASDDNTTDVLTLTGTGTLDEYRDALRAVKYASSSDHPATAKRATFTANDGDVDSNGAFTDITVTRVNDAPSIDLTNTALAYSEGDGPVSIDTSVTVTDPENDQISGATIDVTDANWVAAEDEFAWADNNGADAIVLGTDNDATGTLTLTGNGTLAEYELAIEAIFYTNNSDNPNTTPRDVSATVTDVPGLTSTPDTRNINVARVNDAPLLSNAGTLNYAENDPATQITNTLTVADVDDANLESAKVAVTLGHESDDDLAWVDNNLADTITLATDDNSTDELTLTGTGTLAEYQAALRAVTYENTGNNPQGPKRITFTANDGDADSNGAFADVNITGQNDAPIIDLTNAALAYQEGFGAVPIDTNVTLTDAENNQLSSASVQVTANWLAAEDDLAWVDNSGTDAIVLGTDDDTTGTLTLTGNGTLAEYKAAIEAITYENNSESPSTATRTLSATVTDVPGATSAPDTRNITVASVNDAPVVTTTAGDTPYTEGDGPTTVDGGVTVTDVDDTNIEGGTVSIAPGDLQTGDTLEIDPNPQNGITGTYNSGTGVLTLSGTATVAQYEAALQDVAFSSTNTNPVTSKTIEFKVNDGDVDSNTATKNLAITPVNSAPDVVATNAALAYSEDDPATAVDTGLSVTEPEGDAITGASASITGNFQSGEDALSWTDANLLDNITQGPSTNQTINLTGVDSAANYQAALRDVTYANSSQNPSTLTRTVTFSATEITGGLTGSDTRDITVANVDDAPTADDDAATVLEDAAATSIPVMANDDDIDGGPMSIQSVTQPTNGDVQITGGGTGLTYEPDPNYCNDPPGTTPDTFTYTLNGTPADTATVSMTVTCVNDNAVADNETFNGDDSAHGNTTLQVDDPDDNKPAPTHPHTEITGDLLTGDTDIDGPGPLTVTAGTFATNDGGSVTIESDGDFVFHPAASTSCTDTSDFFDYTVEDGGTPAPVDPDPNLDNIGRVTIAISGCVWYVSNNGAGNSGTSVAPFDTLAQAETASGSNHTVFVFDGDNTSTGYTTGFAMNSGERLIGEHEGLTVDPDSSPGGLTPDSLHPANAGAHPTLTATGEDVIDLDDGNEVRGFNLDPSGAGSGIAGASGDTGGGTIDDVNIVDTGTAGTEPGLELNATTGVFNITNLVVNNSAATTPPSTATGVRLNSAGTVNFLNTGGAQISIITNGAKGLDATSTNMGSGSQFDDITVTNSGVGAVSMTNTTGSTFLGDNSGSDLNLTTTSGATAAFDLDNAGTISVGAGGTLDAVHATGGPAIDVTGTTGPTLDFDDVDSTSSAGDGINLDGLGNGTFNADSGDLGLYSGIGFDLNAGTGAVTYAGNFNNGSGPLAAEITNRTGGAVTFSGPFSDTSDAGGGISVGSNTGGSTTLSDGTKQFNTGASDAVLFNNSDGHTLNLTGGGLDIDSTSGRGLEAATSGTLNVTGTGNTVNTTTGRGVNITNTDIGASNVTFQSVSSNGAANGIQLGTTGSSGSFNVTGTGVSPSGGTIQNSTDAGINLTTVPGGAHFDGVNITSGDNDGVRGTTVSGFTLADAVVTSNGTVPISGGVHGHNGIDFTGLTGTVNLTSSNVSSNADSNVVVDNPSGTLNMTVSGGSYNNATTGGVADGIHVFGSGTGAQNLTVQGPIDIDNNKGDAVFHGSDGDNTTDSNVTVTSADIDNPLNGTGVLAGGITIVHGGATAGGSNVDATITNNNIQNATIGPIVVGTTGTALDPQIARIDATISGNTIGSGAVAGSGSPQGNGIFVDSNGNSDVRAVITNNDVRQWTNRSGLALDAVDGDTSLSAVVQNNIFTQPNSAFAGTTTRGMTLQLGTGQAADTVDVCLDIGHASNAGLKNEVWDTGESPQPDIRYLHEGPNSIVQLVGYGGPASPTITDIANYLRPRNDRNSPTPATEPTVTGVATAAGAQTQNVASCPAITP